MTHYHPALVALHWLLAVIVLFALLYGDDVTLKVHLALGVVIGGLFVFRLGIKLFSSHPLPSCNGLAKVVHNLIYGLVFAVVASGIGIVIEADLLEVILSNASLPVNFSEIPLLCTHNLLTKMLLAVVSLHIVAAFYHRLVLREPIFSKMWVGKLDSHRREN